jgi:hypothetical protein
VSEELENVGHCEGCGEIVLAEPFGGHTVAEPDKHGDPIPVPCGPIHLVRDISDENARLAAENEALRKELEQAREAIRWLYLLCQHYEQGVVATTGDPRGDGKIVVYGKDITTAVRASRSGERRVEGCSKCGSTEIATIYHRFEYDCGWSDKTKVDHEHLHRHCRGCSYDWCDPITLHAAAWTESEKGEEGK